MAKYQRATAVLDGVMFEAVGETPKEAKAKAYDRIKKVLGKKAPAESKVAFDVIEMTGSPQSLKAK